MATKTSKAKSLLTVEGTSEAQTKVIRNEVLPLLKMFPKDALTPDVACEALRVVGKLVEPRPVMVTGCTFTQESSLAKRASKQKKQR